METAAIVLLGAGVPLAIVVIGLIVGFSVAP